MSLYIVFSLILDMVDLPNFSFELFDHPIGVSFGVILIGADSIGDIVLVVSDEPHTVLCFEFVAFIGPCSEGLDLEG